MNPPFISGFSSLLSFLTSIKPMTDYGPRKRRGGAGNPDLFLGKNLSPYDLHLLYLFEIKCFNYYPAIIKDEKLNFSLLSYTNHLFVLLRPTDLKNPNIRLFITYLGTNIKLKNIYSHNPCL